MVPVWGQQVSNLVRFRSPLNVPLSLSGNFMELRNDHFHSGLDMRTESREGLPVMSAGDGWVSRVKVSPWGYGKALYIDHANGHTTVYGHLRDYAGTIAEAVLDAQYKAQSFELDKTFSPGELPVKQGQVVAHGGNSGGSSGPHLHFEVRRTSDQHALDPELFGMEIPDSLAPTFLGLRIDALDSAARVQPYPAKARGWALTGKDGTYALKAGVSPKALGTVGVSVNVIDRYSNSWSTCGIRSMRVLADGQVIFSMHLDEVDFDKQRYANCHTDYALFKGSDMNYHRCYRLPGNKLDLYGQEPAQGRITLQPGRTVRLVIEATDANGNKSVLPVSLIGADPLEALTWPSASLKGDLFRYDRENRIVEADFTFLLPPHSLYADERVQHRAIPGKSPFAPVVKLHDRLTPLHVGGQLSIRVKPAAAKGALEKLLIVRLDEKGRPSPIGGEYKDGWLSSKVRNFGDYTVMIDTLPPKVTLPDMRKVIARDSLVMSVADDLSGIATYSATLDGQWILLEYDPKRKALIHRFDKHTSAKGRHVVQVQASDERGNKTSVTGEFTR